MQMGFHSPSLGDSMRFGLRSVAAACAFLGFELSADDVHAQPVADPFAAPAIAPAPLARPGAPGAAVPENAKKSEEAKDKEEVIDVPRPQPAPLAPQFMRLHLLDGSVIGGDLSIKEIEVATPFGKLVVPIEKVRRFEPGLDSNAALSAQIDKLIKDLGSDDYKTREEAQKALTALGGKVRKELERYSGDENAEIKRRVGEILKALEEQAEEQAGEDESAAEQPWIRLDTVVTTDFTVLGKVSPPQFKIASKYGPLTIQLADVKLAEREVVIRESLQKSVSVDGTNLAQRTFKNTGIRVKPGDKITLRADGNIIMSPWGEGASSGPEGGRNYGWYVANQIPGGALVARVGDKGSIFMVGRQSTFVAKQSGVLQLAVGMQAQYANPGYQFPGQYSVKIKIDPK
jgi:hypothetical protein